MLRTPLKNSKNVNKPFKSPFESPAQKTEQNKDNKQSTNSSSTPKLPQAVKSPLSTRNYEAKRVLLLDDDDKEKKRQKISNTTDKKVHTTSSQCVSKSDLHRLKRKIFEIRQELDCLKSRKQCAIKHEPGELRISINKWRTACQNALEVLCSEFTERNGQSTKISDILQNLGIPENIVHYSEKEDTFI